MCSPQVIDSLQQQNTSNSKTVPTSSQRLLAAIQAMNNLGMNRHGTQHISIDKNQAASFPLPNYPSSHDGINKHLPTHQPSCQSRQRPNLPQHLLEEKKTEDSYLELFSSQASKHKSAGTIKNMISSSSSINGDAFTTSAPGSPKIKPTRQSSGSTTPRVRPPATTLNIPGMTRSKISPDGKISQKDVGAKLVVIMVGLPARGKSYITKKIQRYLSWQQHSTKIFNVGNRRRVVVGSNEPSSSQKTRPIPRNTIIDPPTQAAHILLKGVNPLHMQPKKASRFSLDENLMEQSAEFFDPKNEQASQFRDQVAIATLDELLDFLLLDNGSVGILDATNSTIKRRKALFKQIKDREPKLNILFIESVCQDEKLLEANMHLKLRGPDYRGKDPQKSLADFRKRVAAYGSAYEPLGDYEEDHGMQYIKMIDVGRKIIHFRLQGFLACGIASYLFTFNLSPRQIWITRHGKSVDNTLGKIGGDSDLTEEGEHFATALYNFVDKKRHQWEMNQTKRALNSMNLPQPGDQSPPYPDLLGELETKNFCIWTSMLKRSISTAKEFCDDENYDAKHWEMLNEMHAGSFEGLTDDYIASEYPEEYAKRAMNRLGYIYPGVGGEGYLQVISRLRDMVREIERIKDHVLIIGHRSVCRVLMAYFMDLQREAIADLEIPLGMLFSIEPKPYGIVFHAYKYNEETFDFDEIKDYKYCQRIDSNT